MRRYTIEIDGTSYVIDVQEEAGGRFRVRVGDAEFDVRLSDGESLPQVAVTPAAQPAPPPVSRPAPAVRPATNGGAQGLVTAPMPGQIETVLVRPGERVERGQELLVLEAMKMRNSIRAAQPGVVAEIHVEAGQMVQHGEVLARIDREDA